MRLAVRRLRPAPNTNPNFKGLWQDPVYGYWEQHGKMEFKPGEEYGLTEAEKKAVLHRHRVKEVLKSEYLRREYDPHTFKYRDGVIIDPAMFRWYAADRTHYEFMRHTPKTVMLSYILGFAALFMSIRVFWGTKETSDVACREGDRLWWDRTQGRLVYTSGHARGAPRINSTYGF